jgi:hypothetical protein
MTIASRAVLITERKVGLRIPLSQRAGAHATDFISDDSVFIDFAQKWVLDNGIGRTDLSLRRFSI